MRQEARLIPRGQAALWRSGAMRAAKCCFADTMRRSGRLRFRRMACGWPVGRPTRRYVFGIRPQARRWLFYAGILAPCIPLHSRQIRLRLRRLRAMRRRGFGMWQPAASAWCLRGTQARSTAWLFLVMACSRPPRRWMELCVFGKWRLGDRPQFSRLILAASLACALRPMGRDWRRPPKMAPRGCGM